MKKFIITVIILGSVVAMYYTYLQNNYARARQGLDNLQHIYSQSLDSANRLAQDGN